MYADRVDTAARDLAHTETDHTPHGTVTDHDMNTYRTRCATTQEP